ncbi:MAG TPA: hypothetical protein VE783_00835 [Candidatus Limnocylindrales bacterium]|jgi:hypothetical protein|nr:hypothetical protein [Candidatus Limnocylindrales bacterium]
MRVAKIRPPIQVQFETGDLAEISAIYRSAHAACAPNRCWLQAGERFPVCGDCGANATYILVQPIQHISEDPDFKG